MLFKKIICRQYFRKVTVFFYYLDVSLCFYADIIMLKYNFFNNYLILARIGDTQLKACLRLYCVVNKLVLVLEKAWPAKGRDM